MSESCDQNNMDTAAVITAEEVCCDVVVACDTDVVPSFNEKVSETDVVPSFNEKVSEWARSKLDSNGVVSSFYSDQFCVNLNEFFNFLSELNEYIGALGGRKKYPIEPMMLSMILPMVKATLKNENTRRSILKKILNKVKDDKLWSSIINRNINKLSELAHVIFDELPKTVVDNVVNLIKNDELDEETYSNIFEYIDLLILNLLRFEVLYKQENGNLFSFIKEGSEYRNVVQAFFHKF